VLAGLGTWWRSALNPRLELTLRVRMSPPNHVDEGVGASASRGAEIAVYEQINRSPVGGRKTGSPSPPQFGVWFKFRNVG